MRITKQHVFFWDGWLSNWHPAEIKIETGEETLEFSNSEQLFVYLKAISFADEQTAKKILKDGSDPKKAKALGREVKNYDELEWRKDRERAMFQACYNKFKQNKDLRDKLLDKRFDGLHFVEGSPYDKVWGIGIHFNAASDDESTWQGENLLGKVLDQVRDELKKDLASGTEK